MWMTLNSCGKVSGLAPQAARPSFTPEQVQTLKRRVKAGEKRAGLAREFGISRETLYQYVRVTA
jgi:hypothetical protein